MMIVVVNVHAVAFPFPVAAAIQVIGSNHPVRVVVEHYAADPEIHTPRNKLRPHVLVSAVRIGIPRADPVMGAVPIAVGLVLVPNLMLSVGVPMAAVAA